MIFMLENQSFVFFLKQISNVEHEAKIIIIADEKQLKGTKDDQLLKLCGLVEVTTFYKFSL